MRSGNSEELLRIKPIWPPNSAREEIKIYDDYDYAIAISKKQKDIIQPSLQHATVKWIPAFIKPIELKSRIEGKN
jgi:hypothetical protein